MRTKTNTIETVNANIKTLLASAKTAKELADMANVICTTVKSEYEERIKALRPAKVTIKAVKAEETPTKAKAKTTSATKTAKAKTESKSEDEIAITDIAAIKKLGLKFEQYNERCWVLRGDTKPLRKVLKEEFNGIFNYRLSGGEGWIFRNDNAKACAKALHMSTKGMPV